MEFKPNIYPVMYWGLAYGVAAGVILTVIYFLSNFITVIWFPVFLAGLIFGGFRSWRKQKEEWEKGQGMAPQAKPVMQEFREAVADIAVASQEMMTEEQPGSVPPEVQTEEPQNTVPPAPPAAPQPPAPPRIPTN